jgi:hypothetical protein
MADLKPIGSEKLTGQDKIQRILEIAKYKETSSNNLNETSSTEFSIPLADGSEYQIVKEKQGYVIKRNISESVTDYIEPMKNRKYYPSYSQALKRLNLLAKEINRLNENDEGVELFGEQKKFVLKTPKPEPSAEAETAPIEPPAVPAPALPPSPEVSADMGPGEESPEIDAAVLDAEVPTPDGEVDVEASAEDIQSEPSEDMVTFRTIQKLTGKLTQKIRTFDNQDGMTSEDIKYVINMVLSSLDLKNLSSEDKEDILAKFEEAEEREEEPSQDEENLDITTDSDVEDIQSDMDVPVDQEMGETQGHGAILDNIFKESKVDKVLSKYFEISKKEILQERENKIERKKENQTRLEEKMKNVSKFTESVEQEMASRKFLEENFKFNLVGKTNKKNLVFENSEKQVKITPEGMVL